MKNAWASLGALTLSTATASVLIYVFQMASVGVSLLFSSPFERTVGFRVGIFLGIAVLGLAQFAL